MESNASSNFIWEDNSEENYKVEQRKQMKELQKVLDSTLNKKKRSETSIKDLVLMSTTVSNLSKNALLALDIKYAELTTYHKQLERDSLAAHTSFCQLSNEAQELSAVSKAKINENFQRLKQIENEEYKNTEGDIKLMKYELAQKEAEYQSLKEKAERLAKQAEEKQKQNELYDEYINYTLLQEKYEQLKRQSEQREKMEMEMLYRRKNAAPAQTNRRMVRPTINQQVRPSFFNVDNDNQTYENSFSHTTTRPSCVSVTTESRHDEDVDDNSLYSSRQVLKPQTKIGKSILKPARISKYRN